MKKNLNIYVAHLFYVFVHIRVSYSAAGLIYVQRFISLACFVFCWSIEVIMRKVCIVQYTVMRESWSVFHLQVHYTEKLVVPVNNQF